MRTTIRIDDALYREVKERVTFVIGVVYLTHLFVVQKELGDTCPHYGPI